MRQLLPTSVLHKQNSITPFKLIFSNVVADEPISQGKVDVDSFDRL